jgi:hypothetical protein
MRSIAKHKRFIAIQVVHHHFVSNCNTIGHLESLGLERERAVLLWSGDEWHMMWDPIRIFFRIREPS